MSHDTMLLLAARIQSSATLATRRSSVPPKHGPSMPNNSPLIGSVPEDGLGGLA